MLGQRWWGLGRNASCRAMFIGYVAASIFSGMLYLCLTEQVEVPDRQALRKEAIVVSAATKSPVRKLAALFSIDSLGGCLLTDALPSCWFFRRFGLPVNRLAVLFFPVHVLNALPH